MQTSPSAPDSMLKPVKGYHGKVLRHTERIRQGCELWVAFGRSSVRGCDI